MLLSSFTSDTAIEYQFSRQSVYRRFRTQIVTSKKLPPLATAVDIFLQSTIGFHEDACPSYFSSQHLRQLIHATRKTVSRLPTRKKMCATRVLFFAIANRGFHHAITRNWQKFNILCYERCICKHNNKKFCPVYVIAKPKNRCVTHSCDILKGAHIELSYAFVQISWVRQVVKLKQILKKKT